MKKQKIKEIGYKFCEYPMNIKKSNINYYIAAYKTLINEWAKDFYTPYSLLKKIEHDFSYVIKDEIVLINYTYKQILSIIKNDYKYYIQFYQNIINNKNFSIKICLFSKNKIQDIQKELDTYFYKSESDKIIDIFLKTNAKSINFNDNNINRGCLILIDINKVNIYDEYDFECILDHELNHYFKFIDNNIDYPIENNNAMNIILKYAKICQFDIYSTDFISHMFNDNEFISMCSDVCNILDYEHITYYDWLNFCTNKYISSKKFLLLSSNLQNILFFSFCCRIISVARWNRLKTSVKKQLNCTGLNILQNIKHYIIDKKLQKL